MYQIAGAVQASRQPARLYLCQGLHKLGKGLHSTCMDAFEFSLLDKEIPPRSVQRATHLFTPELRRLSFKHSVWADLSLRLYKPEAITAIFSTNYNNEIRVVLPWPAILVVGD